MMNLKAIVGVLLMGAVALAAPAGAPTVAIDEGSIEFDAGQFSFNVIITGLGSGADGFGTSGDPLVDNILGIDIGVQVTGPAAANVAFSPGSNQLLAGYNAGSWNDVITSSPGGKPYLFADFSTTTALDGLAQSNSQVLALSGGGTVYTHGMLDERQVLDGGTLLGYQGAAPVVDGVVARFIFAWDGTAVTAGNFLQLHIQGGSELPDAKFLTNTVGSGPIFANVDNNDLVIPVPEPATMSLLAIGLGTLIARRRRS